MPGMMRYTDGTRKGKYLVKNRRGEVVKKPFLVITASDSIGALVVRDYVSRATVAHYDPQYLNDLNKLYTEFVDYAEKYGTTDPSSFPYIKAYDDPDTLAEMPGED